MSSSAKAGKSTAARPRVSKAKAAKSAKGKTTRGNGATLASPRASKPRKTATSNVAREDLWTLRLYITGRGERSERALSNLRQLCEQNMAAGTYQIEVIDLLKNPEMAKLDQILAIPTLVRKLPEPMKRVIGDLSNADRALLSLDFPKSSQRP